MSEDDKLLVIQEMAYTSWLESCKAPRILPGEEVRRCRRVTGHTGSHVSGPMAQLVWRTEES